MPLNPCSELTFGLLKDGHPTWSNGEAKSIFEPMPGYDFAI
jgi:hypothetical protein